jgi:plastocyanin domain-containing protein
MDATEIMVVVGGALLVGFIVWFFFMGEGEREAARVEAGVQRIKINVKGGYSPDVLVVKRGVPVRLDFYRDEASTCTEQVVLPEFNISRRLPAFETTTVAFTPEREGKFTFMCGMGMVHGQLVVES